MVPSTCRNDFERGSTGLYDIECTDVGPLTKIIIGHDNSGMGASWHCQSVTVDNLKTGEHLHFEINRWFSKNQDDKAIEREYFAAPAKSGPRTRWLLSVYTGTQTGAGTDASVSVEIYGTTDKFGPYALPSVKGSFVFSL